MQLKVMYNDESRVFWVNRHEDSLSFLFEKAVADFELLERRENLRLRAFNIANNIMQDTYTGREAESFFTLKIYPLKTLVLEEKQSGEEFEEYDPTQMFIKVNLWRPGLVTLAEAELKPKQLKVAKDMQLSDFLALLGQKFHIEVD